MVAATKNTAALFKNDVVKNCKCNQWIENEKKNAHSKSHRPFFDRLLGWLLVNGGRLFAIVQHYVLSHYY